MSRSDPTPLLLTRRVFLAGLALVYLLAFASFGVQVEGLLGADGVLPASRLLAHAREQLGGAAAAWRLPSLFWLASSDAALEGACAAGVALATLALLGVAVGPALLACFALYLSLVAVGDVFLSYQWDALLLEAGFLAVLLAPWRLRPSRARRVRVRMGVVWLLRWLLFRLLFQSGTAKLLSGDPTWRDLSALEYHYWTQPLPTWIAWYAHALPDRIQRLSAAGALAIELGFCFLIFGSRRMRALACGATALLMATIALTGNYGFFNLLTLVLCVPLLDDRALRAVLPERWRPRERPPEARAPALAGRVALGAACAALAALGGLVVLQRLGVPLREAPPLAAAVRTAGTLRIVNPYGLFAVMTTRRDEIVFEGSHDAREWRAYEFRWKPGRLERAPAFSAPHMPRLDWTLWFAALGSCEQHPWLRAFERRLLEGSPAVLRLLADDPFPERPPALLRAKLFRYGFTRPGDPDARERWWRREPLGLYCPTLRRDALEPAPRPIGPRRHSRS